MVILGMGTEIVECVRIGRLIADHGDAFLGRIFTEREMQACHARRDATRHFAATWAAKEAVLRALGLGPAPRIGRTSLEVRVGDGRQPEVVIRGQVRDEAVARGVGEILVSLAHCRTYATANALVLGGPRPQAARRPDEDD